jgi:hypothetical protein
LKQLVAAYEDGKFMRLMRAFHHLRSRMRGNAFFL